MALVPRARTDWWPELRFPPINLWSIWSREKKMKINYIKKDITTVKKGMVIHGCNCSRGFGSGVAGAIKKVWPQVEIMFRANKNPILADIQVCKLNDDLYVANAYTQRNYGYDGIVYANIDAIDSILHEIILACIDKNIKDLYMPKIGCGYGGLNWEEDIEPILKSIKTNEINIYVCSL